MCQRNSTIWCSRPPRANPPTGTPTQQDMAGELDAIVDELDLPEFRVPAPRNSAQHLSAALYHSHVQAQQATTDSTADHRRHRPCWRRGSTPGNSLATIGSSRSPETRTTNIRASQDISPGIEMSEFYWARQRAKRALLFWVVAVLTLTGLIAAAAWTLGGNIATLI